MAVTKQQKDDILAELKDKFGKSKSIIFAKNLGLSVKEIAELRNRLREQNVEYKIAKKTLMRLAAKEQGIDEIPDEIMEGPVGAALSYEDQVAAANILHKFAKETKKIELVGGVLDNEVMDKVKVKQLATLPSREELLAKLVGSMKSPISGFYGVLHGVLSGFVRTLNGVKDKKAETEK